MEAYFGMSYSKERLSFDPANFCSNALTANISKNDRDSH